MEKEYSIVIPVLNEAESLKELLSNIKKAFLPTKTSYEVIFIDDGSTDETLNLLKTIEENEKLVRVFSFRRNLGKSAALMLGFKKANGRYIVTLDADLQDDPANIKGLRLKLKNGNFDLVSGWRKDRKDKKIKKVSSWMFNKIVSILFEMNIHDLNSGLKLYKAETAKELNLYGGMHRFIPVIAKELGYKVAEKEIVHHERKYGKSKYRSSKIFTDIPDIITIYFLTKYTRRPLHFFGKVGSALFFIGFLMLSYLSYLHFIGEKIGTRPLLLFGVLLVMVGVQTVFTGLLADLFVHTNKENNNFPIKYASSK